ncbi:hypothetical protein T06_13413 [Trichinella sp. T6]|nr:hypothetical protein T06_13413 [Trichinella sp. T6]
MNRKEFVDPEIMMPLNSKVEITQPTLIYWRKCRGYVSSGCRGYVLIYRVNGSRAQHLAVEKFSEQETVKRIFQSKVGSFSVCNHVSAPLH